jgi:hypothetical protein
MFDNDSYCDWQSELIFVESAAAVTELACGPTQGELWRVGFLAGYHDDPAAHDLFYALVQAAVIRDIGTVLNCAQYARIQFYERAHCPAPLILRYGDGILVRSTAPMAAGKKLYIIGWVQKLKGATS